MMRHGEVKIPDIGTSPHHDAIGKWCKLLDPRCKGILCLAIELSNSGMRMNGVGVVPHDEYRLATDDEIKKWLARE